MRDIRVGADRKLQRAGAAGFFLCMRGRAVDSVDEVDGVDSFPVHGSGLNGSLLFRLAWGSGFLQSVAWIAEMGI